MGKTKEKYLDEIEYFINRFEGDSSNLKNILEGSTFRKELESNYGIVPNPPDPFVRVSWSYDKFEEFKNESEDLLAYLGEKIIDVNLNKDLLDPKKVRKSLDRFVKTRNFFAYSAIASASHFTLSPLLMYFGDFGGFVLGTSFLALLAFVPSLILSRIDPSESRPLGQYTELYSLAWKYDRRISSSEEE